MTLYFQVSLCEKRPFPLNLILVKTNSVLTYSNTVGIINTARIINDNNGKIAKNSNAKIIPMILRTLKNIVQFF